MTGQVRNLSASGAAQLLHRAKETGDVRQTLLTRVCFREADFRRETTIRSCRMVRSDGTREVARVVETAP